VVQASRSRRASPVELSRPRRRATYPPVHNLPATHTSFVGRDAALTELGVLLNETRLLTLTGTGGVGKTRLALELASRHAASYPDGVWWVELASLSDASLVPQAVAAVLDVREQPGRPLPEILAAILRSRATLVLLDNCEHVLKACADLADALVGACPGLTILATSRQALGLPSETVWRVPSLSLPDPQAGRSSRAGPVLASAAEQLLAGRAAVARPGFAITERNRAAVVEVCHRLDGIPLALELAASRLKVLSVEQLADLLEDRFRLLSARGPAPLPRQSTLRATLDWSYSLLSTDEQAFLRALSVFAGGCSLEAASAICAPDRAVDDVLDLLSGLVDKSLIHVDERAGVARYRLLETVRAYAEEKLQESGEDQALHERHRGFYLALAEEAETGLFGAEQERWLASLETEHDNLRVALESSRETDAGMRLAAALGQFWLVRGFLNEGRGWLTAMLARPSPRTLSRTKAVYQAAVLAFMQGDYAVAGPLAEEVRSASEALEDREGVARSIHLLAGLESLQGRFPRSAQMLDEALGEFDAEGSKRLRAMWLYARAQAARALGELEQAVKLSREGLALTREDGDQWGVRHWLMLLGQMDLALGRPDTAVPQLREGLVLGREMRDRQGAADALESLGWATAALGQLERAAWLLGAAAGIRESLAMRLFPFWQPEHDRAETAARAALGGEAYASAFSQGSELSLEEAIAVALADDPFPLGSPLAPEDDLSAVLTAREREIAALLAQGKSNRQVADDLVISEGTAATHVRNILGKLDFSSRAQIAAWAVRRGLDQPSAN
jgi:predicted ATPase/DNA-binding CsgD family transcriptional regulator/tetratricopeptide (TPR) repeat protein